MFLEVIAQNLEDVILINKTKASRIELCANLEQDGFTPSYEIIKEVCDYSKLPVNVIVRHKNNNFLSEKEEVSLILKDIEYIKSTKANGIVIGLLNENLSVDVEFLKKVIEIKEHLTITFHKAFDHVKNFLEEYKTLNDLGIDFVLTSGGPTLNINILKELKKLNLKTKILIGGGVTLNNVKDLKKISKYIHIGTAARVNNSFNNDISIENINSITGVVQ